MVVTQAEVVRLGWRAECWKQARSGWLERKGQTDLLGLYILMYEIWLGGKVGCGEGRGSGRIL